jgi:DNA polymerase (family X)
MRVFRGSEADILADGAIDYDAPTLARLDFVVASIHSRFRMGREEMTGRMTRALANPWVTFLGHLTGRLLLKRHSYEIDLDEVFAAAAENGVMIEINADPRRMEIDWRLIGRAREHGVGFSIHPDAHSTGAYASVALGVWLARKAGLGPDEVFNTRPLAAVEEALKNRRARAEEMLRGREAPGNVVRTLS